MSVVKRKYRHGVGNFNIQGQKVKIVNSQIKKFALIAVGYNRVSGLERLLKSLSSAEYHGDTVTLIISIDNSGSDAVEKFARSYNWEYGEKRIRTFPERQGLRNHILSCGDFLEEFDAVAVLEDDIVVSPGFYSYMKESVARYADDMRIAGISLYSPKWNGFAQIPFVPEYSTSDVYFLQLAQSWGQIWLKKQWFDFKKWYHKNIDMDMNDGLVPKNVAGWAASSWLKYHIRYCVEHNKYFVCPYHALSTCYSEKGEHYKHDTGIAQVPMLSTNKQGYDFEDLNGINSVKYDAFYERLISCGSCNDISYSEICFDLNGTRHNYQNKKYLITPNILGYKVLFSFGSVLLPQEENIFMNVQGKSFFLYDLGTIAGYPKVDNRNELMMYRFRLYNQGRRLLKYVIRAIFSSIKQKVIKFFER